MANITITVPELNEIIRTFDQAPEFAKMELSKALRKSAISIQRDALQEAPVNDGILRSGIRSQFPTQMVAKVSSTADYSIYVHEGTRPHRAPFEPVARWSRKKGLPPGAVWRSIAKKGTKANPYMKRAADRSDSPIQKHFNLALSRISGYIAEGR